MMSLSKPARGRLLSILALAGVAVAAAAIGPAPSAAQVPFPINPIDAVKGVLQGPSELAGQVGASAMQQGLEWLLGGVRTTITVALVKFLVHVDVPTGRSLVQATGPLIVIGGFFLLVGLIASIADGYRDVIAGSDTGPRVIGQAIFRVIGLALLFGSWFWIVPLAVDVANGMSGYVLGDEAVGRALQRSFGTGRLLEGVFPLLALITAVGIGCSILALVVLKFMMAIAFACLYVGGPALLGFAALPRIGGFALALVGRGLVVLTLIPLAWTVVFAAWAGVSAGTYDAMDGGGGSPVAALMGPGLFLAGMLVLLGVTKKLLAMATFGISTTVPGSRLARYALSAAIVRKAAPALAASATSRASEPTGTGGPEDVRIQRERQGGAAHRQSAGPLQQPEHPRTLAVAGGREERDARRREADRVRQAHDANAIGTTSDGVWRSRNAPPEEVASFSERVTDVRTVAAEVPEERLQEVRRELPIADRSAFAAAAQAAKEAHPDDPEAAWRTFRDAGARQYAGRRLEPEKRDAIETTLAASPAAVERVYASDYEKFGGRPTPAASPTGTGRSHDAALFDPQGLERFRTRDQAAAADAPTSRLSTESRGDDDAPSH